MSLNAKEQFIHDTASAIDDAINSHTGLLRSLVLRIDPCYKDDVQGPLKDFLQRQIEQLQQKRRRMMERLVEFAGGPDAFGDIQVRWWSQATKAERATPAPSQMGPPTHRQINDVDAAIVREKPRQYVVSVSVEDYEAALRCAKWYRDRLAAAEAQVAELQQRVNAAETCHDC